MPVDKDTSLRTRFHLLLSMTFAVLLGAWLLAALGSGGDIPGEIPAVSAAQGTTFQITKTVQPQVVSPGSLLTYQVTLTNASPVTSTVQAITDVLPAGFIFAGIASGSDPRIPYPGDTTSPDIVWSTPVTVPATTTMSLRYWVFVPHSTPYRNLPYTNTVAADVLDGGLAQSSAGVRVESSDVTVTKLAEPTRVISGSVLTYTVVFANRGNATGILHKITDTLPDGFTYLGVISGSDITTTPVGITGTISWSGAFSVTAGQSITLSYRTQAPPTHKEFSIVNRVAAEVDGRPTEQAAVTTTLVPETSYVFLPLVVRRWGPPTFVLAKTATLSTVAPGDPVTYTATIANIGSETGDLAAISDTLPSGFMLQAMLPGDITALPVGNSGTVVWSGPITVAGFTTKTLSYRVRTSDTPGIYSNKLDVWVAVGSNVSGPAQASVEVKNPLLLEDHFEGGIVSGWEPFLNYWRLHPEQWLWDPEDGINGSGAVTHVSWYGAPSAEQGAEDAVYMYLGSGAQQWTDYRYKAKLIVRDREGDGNVGLWFRGQYEEFTDGSGQWLTGYYLVLGGSPYRNTWVVRLMQIQIPGDCKDNACNSPGNLYDFGNPMELDRTKYQGTFQMNHWYDVVVEVRGNHIQAWVDGTLSIDYVDDVLPFLQGSVGFQGYKLRHASWDDVVVTPLK